MKMTKYNVNYPQQDEYGTVVNSQQTYESLATTLIQKGQVIFAWTDGKGTQLDILLSYSPTQYGHLQRGMRSNASDYLDYLSYSDLFVAISHFGMFGFLLNGVDKEPSYIGDKLNLDGDNETTQELAKLINGIAGLLVKPRHFDQDDIIAEQDEANRRIIANPAPPQGKFNPPNERVKRLK